MSSDSDSHWFWRYGYIVVVPIILLVVWVAKSDDRENQNNVNPEVFVFFKEVEEACRSVSFDEQTEECLKIEVYQKDCKLFSSKCNSLSFYTLLKNLKYQVPQYYQEGFAAK